jgi:hypothetical protein
MNLQRQRSNRLSVTDQVEVFSYPDGLPLGMGQLRNISEGGVAMELPVCIQPGARVQVKLSTIRDDLLRHFQFLGSVVRAETWGQNCIHGVQFFKMTEMERRSLMDYFHEIESHYSVTSWRNS